MPSPVAHSLAGCCFAVAARSGGARSGGLTAAILVAANLPDIDFLLGPLLRPLGIALEHQGPTHSLAFAAAAAVPLALLARGGRRRLAAWSWIGAAGAFHLLLDFFNHDRRALTGFPLLWPLDARLFLSPVAIFPGVDRALVFGVRNLHELAVELALGVPCLLLALRLGRRASPR